MSQIYHCNPCNVDFPDKDTAMQHRDGTGHELELIDKKG